MASATFDANNRASAWNGTALSYDALGRRQAKTIGGTQTAFLYDGANPVQELSGASVTANLLTGLGIDEVFARTEGASTDHYLSDALGSTVRLTDASATKLVDLHLRALRQDERRRGHHQRLPVHRKRERRHGAVLLPGALHEPGDGKVHR